MSLSMNQFWNLEAFENFCIPIKIGDSILFVCFENPYFQVHY